tara:strand:- start:216 stop:1871 length:1656 start_codon:yes stop_codon:yes gene_type:complete
MENSNPHIPVSVGEIFDKYSILEIKLHKIKDASKLKHVETELQFLKPFIDKFNLDNNVYDKLKKINLALWEIEDKLRIKESKKQFDDEFIQLARSVYFTNDDRGDVKKEINNIFHSSIFEVKSYVDYKETSLQDDFDMATQLVNQGKYMESIQAYTDLSIKIQEKESGNSQHAYLSSVYKNIGCGYFHIRKYKEAIEYFKKSNSYGSFDIAALGNIAACLGYLNRMKEGIDTIKNAISFDTQHFATSQLGFLYLKNKEIQEGLSCIHNSILLSNQNDNNDVLNPIPIWDGTQKCNTLLVNNTQGLGDQVQFTRYLFQLSDMFPAMKIHYFIGKQLVELIDFQNYPNITPVWGIYDISIYDYRIRLLSVLYVLKIDHITPFTGTSYIVEDDNKTKQWKDTLANTCKKKLRIALCWKGTHPHIEKHIPLHMFKSISSLDVDIISIQCGDGSDEISKCGFDILNFDIDKEVAFVDTIAIMRNVDMVITIDTSITHLAGTMGINTWLLLGATSDWRWFDNTENSDWYQSVKIFKGDTHGDWSGVVEEVEKELYTL